MKKGTYKDLTGQKYNRMTLLSLDRIDGHARWLCRCDCGKEVVVRGHEVVSGKIKSCGCFSRERKVERITAWSKLPYKEKGLSGRKRSDGYIYLRRPDHPAASTEGYVAAHRIAAEEKIGRLLKQNEVVHHWDEQPTNNAPANLCVFRSNSPHFRLHLYAKRHGIKIETLKFDQPWLCLSN